MCPHGNPVHDCMKCVFKRKAIKRNDFYPWEYARFHCQMYDAAKFELLAKFGWKDWATRWDPMWADTVEAEASGRGNAGKGGGKGGKGAGKGASPGKSSPFLRYPEPGDHDDTDYYQGGLERTPGTSRDAEQYYQEGFPFLAYPEPGTPKSGTTSPFRGGLGTIPPGDAAADAAAQQNRFGNEKGAYQMQQKVRLDPGFDYPDEDKLLPRAERARRREHMFTMFLRQFGGRIGYGQELEPTALLKHAEAVDDLSLRIMYDPAYDPWREDSLFGRTDEADPGRPGLGHEFNAKTWGWRAGEVEWGSVRDDVLFTRISLERALLTDVVR